MNAVKLRKREGGFALVLTLVLLALLVVVVLGLAGLARLGQRQTAMMERHVQARQNALAGLQLALGALQHHAGPDARLTAMAGVAGVVPGVDGAKRRHWCGVWDRDGTWQTWLASGASVSVVPSLAYGTAPVLLIGPGTVGTETSDSEHVEVGLLPVGETGALAWWVGDEGVKLSVETEADSLQLWPATSPTSARQLREALEAGAARLPRVLVYEQLRFLPSPSSLLSNSVSQDNFHHVTRAAVQEDGRVGRLNLNTTSVRVWRAVLEAYNRIAAQDPETPLFTTARLGTTSTRLRDRFASAGETGKIANGPFVSVEAFWGSEFLAEVLAGSGVSAEQLMAVVGLKLAVRSDTFRVRAYGQAGRVLDSGGVERAEARAWCEAMVQRTSEELPGFGRRFRVIGFRWLGSDDI